MSHEWVKVSKGDKRALALANRHYSRQSRGSPQFCRPGHNIVLLLQDSSALWVSWKPAPPIKRMDKLEVYECALFRNEGTSLSSDLIKQAVDITENLWGKSLEGWVTYIDKHKVKSLNPGYCFQMAGWVKNGTAKNKNLIRLRLKERRLTK